jgi:multiple sugar transport system substrate-binding protein
MEKIQISGDGNYETDLLAKGFKPDIILTGLGTSYLNPLKETGLAYDMTSMAKAAKLDLSRLEPVRLNYAQNLDGNSDLTVVPYMLDVAALFYNKDIFDRFGVSYPKDRMTWNQTIELAKKVTRTSDGVQYRGFEADALLRNSGQLDLHIVNPKTNKASVNNEGWKQLLTMLKQVYDIPGNEKRTQAGKAREEFSKSKNLAMLNSIGLDGFDAIPNLNWDIVTYPVYESAPDIGLRLGGRALAVTAISSHKEAAFQLIELWLSEEVQKKLSASGQAPALNIPAAKAAFGSDLPGLKGKNLQSLFLLHSVKYTPESENESIVRKPLNDAYWAFLDNKMDVNTALRQAEEQINVVLSEVK